MSQVPPGSTERRSLHEQPTVRDVDLQQEGLAQIRAGGWEFIRQFRRVGQQAGGLTGLIIVGAYLLLAMLGEPFAPYSYTEQQLLHTLEAPSAAHWFGTDQFGRDILSRVLAGGRTIMLLASSATLLTLLIGVSLGMLAGYFGGWRDEILSRIVDLLLSFPAMLLALLIVTILGSAPIYLILCEGIVLAPFTARVVRSVVLDLKTREFVDAARLRGESALSIMMREILPNATGPIIVEGTLNFSYAIMLTAGLSFLGLGVQPPSPEWGLQVSEGISFLLIAPWVIVAPSLAITLLVIGVNMLADSVGYTLNQRPAALGIRPPPRHTPTPNLTPAESQSQVVLRLEDLHVAYPAQTAWIDVVRGVSLELRRGEIYGLVGESGCGKSTTAIAAMGYQDDARISQGRVLFEGRDLARLPLPELRRIWGCRIALVPQNPQAALNPAIPIGDQIAEVLVHHEGVTLREALARTRAILENVHMPDPTAAMRRYPHQLSGGQQQRVAIATALIANPDVLIMDEPTTGLDVTTEATVLDLVNELRQMTNAAILYISHDLRVIGRVCDRVGIMYAGQLVESGLTTAIFGAPRHPYTHDLLHCAPNMSRHYRQGRLTTIEGQVPQVDALPSGCTYQPRCKQARERCRCDVPALSVEDEGSVRCFFSMDEGSPQEAVVAAKLPPNITPSPSLLTVAALEKRYQSGGILASARGQRSHIHAVRRVSLMISPGETLALVGESGSGKTTLGRCIVGLTRPNVGQISFRGEDMAGLVGERRVSTRQALQMVFQNPDATLNPRHQIGQILDRTLLKFGVSERVERRRQIAELLEAVRLPHHYALRYPDQLSGGEKQRVGIARAFAGNPSLIVCDEAVSALDVSVQSAILNLLIDLKQQRGCAYLFISHDLSVVRYIADRVGVMYQGQIVELGPTEQIFTAPMHAYTRSLLATTKGERITE